MSKEPIGTLVVVVLKARNLNDKHSLYKQDVFATASLNGTEKRTHVDVKGGQHPEWDVEVRFQVFKGDGEKQRKLEVACFAKEHRSDDLLGKGIVDISETLKTGEFDDWVPLDINGVVRGDIYLEMTYYSASPPAGGLKPATNTSLLQRRPSKLPPADRLSRPPALAPTIQPVLEVPLQPRQPATHARPNQPEIHARPLAEATKPKPEAIPDILRPAGAGKTSKPAVVVHSGAPSALPSSLRPGNPNTTTIPASSQSYQTQKPHVIQPASQYQHQQPTTHEHPIRPGYPMFQQPYNPVFANPSTPQPRITPYPTVPALEEPIDGPLTFPVPSGPSMIEPPQRGPIYSTTGPYSSSSPPRDDSHYRPPPVPSRYDYTAPLANPYTSAPPIERYQSPLPLPSDTKGEDVPPVPRKVSPTPDRTRIDELRLVEEEAARRKAQEDKDLELALKLDRELNLLEEEVSRTRTELQIPGGWSK